MLYLHSYTHRYKYRVHYHYGYGAMQKFDGMHVDSTTSDFTVNETDTRNWRFQLITEIIVYQVFSGIFNRNRESE